MRETFVPAVIRWAQIIMARSVFRGDAVAREDIYKVTVNTVISGARYGLKVWNRPLASVTALNGEDLGDLAKRFRVAVENAGINVSPAVSGGEFTFWGIPGEAVGPAIDASPGCYVQVVRKGVATTAQVFRIIMPVGASGGTWKITMGWGTLRYDTSSMAHNVAETTLASEISNAANEVGGPSWTGVRATLVHPGSSTQSRIYEVTMGGTFSGLDFLVEPDGAALQGTATVTAKTVQIAGYKATCIQAIQFNLLPNYNGGRQQKIKFSRGTVTSREVSVEGTINQADIEAAIADVVGVNKVTVTLGVNGGWIVIILKWNALGDQAAVAASSYDTGNSSPGIPSTTQTTIVRASGANQNEFLLAIVGQGVGAGGATVINGVPQVQPSNYEVTQGSTTWTITHNYATTTAQLVTQWEAGVGAGNVGIYSLAAMRNIYLVEFKGSKSNLDQLPVTFTTAGGRSFTVICDGEPLQNQIDQVIIRADGGTFTASSNGTTFTSALAYNLTNTTFQTSLRGLAAIGSGNCNVTGSGTPADPFLVEYVGAKASTTMPVLVFNVSSLLGGYDPEIVYVTKGDPGVRQLDAVFIDPNAISGSVTPLVGGIVGKAVAYNGNAAAWETGVEGAGVGVGVTGIVGGPFFVEYDVAGPRSLTLDQSLLVVSESTLFSLTQIQEATGPLHYNEPLNWATGVVPGSEDIPVFMDSKASCQEGLRQRCTFSADIPTGDFRLGTNVNDCGDFAVGQKVRISTTGTFPTATINGSAHTLLAGNDYYVISIDRFRRRMQLSTTRSGVGIELTGAGTGVHTVTVRWGKIEQRRSHTGSIGRSRRLGDAWEERPRYLKGETLALEIGAGESGSGTGLCFLDLGTTAFDSDVWFTGNARDGEQALQVICSNAANNLYIRGGEVGFGTDEQACVMGELIGQGADITLGLVTLSSLDFTDCSHSFPLGITVSGKVRIV